MTSDKLPLVLADAVSRIVAVAHPRQIVLFGSAAREDLGPDSDLDLLVIIPTGGHRRQTAQAIYRGLVGLGYAADVVVVTEDDVARHGRNPTLVIRPALEEGRVLYAA